MKKLSIKFLCITLIVGLSMATLVTNDTIIKASHVINSITSSEATLNNTTVKLSGSNISDNEFKLDFNVTNNNPVTLATTNVVIIQDNLSEEVDGNELVIDEAINAIKQASPTTSTVYELNYNSSEVSATNDVHVGSVEEAVEWLNTDYEPNTNNVYYHLGTDENLTTLQGAEAAVAAVKANELAKELADTTNSYQQQTPVETLSFNLGFNKAFSMTSTAIEIDTNLVQTSEESFNNDTNTFNIVFNDIAVSSFNFSISLMLSDNQNVAYDLFDTYNISLNNQPFDIKNLQVSYNEISEEPNVDQEVNPEEPNVDEEVNPEEPTTDDPNLEEEQEVVDEEEKGPITASKDKDSTIEPYRITAPKYCYERASNSERCLKPKPGIVPGVGTESKVNYDLNKTAVDNGDGTFKITLEMDGNYGLVNTNYNADIVLVFDYSGSMEEKTKIKNSDGNVVEITKMQAAIVSALVFAKKVFELNVKNPGRVKIALVAYNGGNYENGYEWEKPGKDSYLWHNYSSDLSSLTKTLASKDEPNGGTNMQDGIWSSAYVLSKSQRSAMRYVVMLGDGAPTYSHNSNESGNSTSDTEKKATYNEYDEMYLRYNGEQGPGEKAVIPDANVYSVGFGISKNSEAATIMSTIQNAASKNDWKNNYIAESGDDLYKIYDQIAKDITVGGKPPTNAFESATISDVVTNHFTVVSKPEEIVAKNGDGEVIANQTLAEINKIPHPSGDDYLTTEEVVVNLQEVPYSEVKSETDKSSNIKVEFNIAPKNQYFSGSYIPTNVEAKFDHVPNGSDKVVSEIFKDEPTVNIAGKGQRIYIRKALEIEMEGVPGSRYRYELPTNMSDLTTNERKALDQHFPGVVSYSYGETGKEETVNLLGGNTSLLENSEYLMSFDYRTIDKETRSVDNKLLYQNNGKVNTNYGEDNYNSEYLLIDHPIEFKNTFNYDQIPGLSSLKFNIYEINKTKDGTETLELVGKEITKIPELELADYLIEMVSLYTIIPGELTIEKVVTNEEGNISYNDERDFLVSLDGDYRVLFDGDDDETNNVINSVSNFSLTPETPVTIKGVFSAFYPAKYEKDYPELLRILLPTNNLKIDELDVINYNQTSIEVSRDGDKYIGITSDTKTVFNRDNPKLHYRITNELTNDLYWFDEGIANNKFNYEFTIPSIE